MTTVEIAVLSLIVSSTSLVIATVLAWIRVLEYKRDNRDVQISYSMGHFPGEWNIVYLTNISSKPILIDYWDAAWGHKSLFFKSHYEDIIPYNNQNLHINLAPHSRTQIDFKDQYEFNWNPKNRCKVKLYLKLQIAGKKNPSYLFLFNPN